MIYHIIYVGKGRGRRKVAQPVENREQFVALRNSEGNLHNLALARQGDDAAKAKLVQLAYNLGHVDGRLAGCKSIGSHFFHDVDCYDPEQSALLKDLILAKKDEIGLEMLEQSAKGGWHLVCRREQGRTILENQVRVSTILRLEMDTSAHDLQRVVFSTSASPDDLVYLADSLFEEPMSPEACEDEYQRLKIREQRGQEEVPAGAKKANKHYRPWEDAAQPKPATQPALHTGQAAESTAGAGAAEAAQVSERIRFIARGVMKEKGLLATDFTDEGGRHTTVKMLLSGATQLLTKPEMNAVLQELMPDHWRDQNIQQLVDDFYQNYTNPNQRLLKYQENLFTQSRRLDKDNGASTDEATQATPPEMPRKLPPLITLLLKNTPDIYRPAVSHAVFPSLAAHLHRTRFRYIDNVEHEATLMNVLMAGTGAGKDCITEPINRIMADIRRRDDENLAREKAWKQSVVSRGANKDKAERPKGLVIQEIDPDVTNAAFVQRMAEADEHFLYAMLNEIEQFDALRGNGRSGQHFQIMCLAFDHNHRYGQTRVGAQSVTEKVTIRFNWNASTTIQCGQQYFRNVLTKGPLSRINFCTIPEREIGAEMPVYGTYDDAFDEELRPYIENLTAAHGLIECKPALLLAEQLKDECADFSRLSQSRVYENFSFRALVIAYLKACVLYVAHHCQWLNEMEDFVRWSLQYDLWCKMHFFGEAIERENSINNERTSRRGPRNLLELLSDEFTFDDAVSVRRNNGLSATGTKAMIRTWRNRGYIKERTNEQLNSFLKVKS